MPYAKDGEVIRDQAPPLAGPQYPPGATVRVKRFDTEATVKWARWSPVSEQWQCRVELPSGKRWLLPESFLYQNSP